MNRSCRYSGRTRRASGEICLYGAAGGGWKGTGRGEWVDSGQMPEEGANVARMYCKSSNPGRSGVLRCEIPGLDRLT